MASQKDKALSRNHHIDSSELLGRTSQPETKPYSTGTRNRRLYRKIEPNNPLAAFIQKPRQNGFLLLPGARKDFLERIKRFPNHEISQAWVDFRNSYYEMLPATAVPNDISLVTTFLEKRLKVSVEQK